MLTIIIHAPTPSCRFTSLVVAVPDLTLGSSCGGVEGARGGRRVVNNLSTLERSPLVPEETSVSIGQSCHASDMITYRFTQIDMAVRMVSTDSTFQPIFLRSSISGSADQLRNSTTSLAI